MKKIIATIAGARPNFMKVAPLIREYKKYSDIQQFLIHTGQHYDHDLSGVFFDELGIPRPDVNLGVRRGTSGEQTGNITAALGPILRTIKPNIVVVVGDVNSTLAGALAAKYLNITIAHVEAGLRSFDMTMPEEINRILTDRISDLLFVTEKSGVDNLMKEGVNKNSIYLTGNAMIDSLRYGLSKKIIKSVKEKPTPFAVLTLHRPSNVDNKDSLKKMVSILNTVRKMGVRVVFPVHPRTKRNIKKFALQKAFHQAEIIPPMGYFDFMKLLMESSFVLTDSGGIQEETSWLQIPCLTMRENTERPITVDKGTNTLVGLDEGKIIEAITNILGGHYKKGQTIPLWDGRTAERIVKKIHDYLEH